MNKFWTKQGNMVGTAHKNRNGELVDFRPLELSFEKNDRRRMRILRLEVTSSETSIIIEPPKGVEIKPLRLTASLINREVIEDEVCFARFRETWRAEFEGVEFSACREVRENKNTPEANELRAAVEVQRVSQRKAEERRAQFVAERMATMSPSDFLTIATPSNQEWGRLQSSKWEKTFCELAQRVHKTVQKELVPDDFVTGTASLHHTSKTWKEAMRHGLLALNIEKRAEKKAEFLSRQGRG